jgi:hypothetical protein
MEEFSMYTVDKLEQKIKKIVGTTDSDIYIEWTTGGLRGGSCWGGKADSPREADPEPTFDELSLVLEELCPNMTFLSYGKLVKTLVKQSERTRNDYYGNYSVEARKTIVIKELAQYLVDHVL